MYEPKGHYAPHYDHLFAHSDPEQRDWWMKHFGNRIATFLLILEKAERGGATVFPLLGRNGVTVQPNIGDALFWFNADATDERERSSLHGACPITAGRKVAATIWVRTIGQELLLPCPTGDSRSYLFEQTFL
uniref:Fe2OG dioxygenase domain-containing protein n=1 Tax=Plectus sambesii TaxID=2011161 RepID=A0A914V8U4_9BILA